MDNITAASDRVLQLMDRLELPKLLRRTADRSHTSSNGQKFAVRVDSLNANHSFKYFGKEQGMSVYTFRDERDLLWHSLVFSAADREREERWLRLVGQPIPVLKRRLAGG